MLSLPYMHAPAGNPSNNQNVQSFHFDFHFESFMLSDKVLDPCKKYKKQTKAKKKAKRILVWNKNFSTADIFMP